MTDQGADEGDAGSARDPAAVVDDLVARTRYPLSGRTDECQVPPPELRERFAERAIDT